MAVSIVAPLNKKLEYINEHYLDILYNFRYGRPKGASEITSLIQAVKNLKSDAEAAKASFNTQFTQAGLLKQELAYRVKVIAFYINEFLEVIKLLKNLAILIAKIFSLATLLTLVVEELKLVIDTINNYKLWLERTYNRIKQRVQKEIEWQKRKLLAKAMKKYYEIQLRGYSQRKEQLVEVSKTFNKSGPQPTQGALPPDYKVNNKVNPIYSDPALVKWAIDRLDEKITDAKKEIEFYENEIAPNGNIKKDRDLWNKRWREEAIKDRETLLRNPLTVYQERKAALASA